MIEANQRQVIFFKSIFTIKNLLCFFFICIAFLLDRISKFKAINQLLDQNNIYFNEFINFSLVWNTGIGFGLLSSDSNIIYNSITFIIGLIIIFLIYLVIKSNTIDKFFFSIIAGGALGNIYDRIFFMAVPDFIDIHYQNFHWFTFNIADIFISVGVIMLILKELIFKNEKV